MSKVVAATCVDNKVTAQGVQVDAPVTVMSEGKAPSAGFIVLDEALKVYFAKITPDLKTTIEQAIAGLQAAVASLAEASSGLSSTASSMGTVAAAAGIPGLAIPALTLPISSAATGVTSAAEGITEAITALTTLKDNLK